MKTYDFPKDSIPAKIQTSLSEAIKSIFGIDIAKNSIQVEKPQDKEHGDFASNVAMTATKLIGRNPREIATSLVEWLSGNGLFTKIEVAGPGFVNFYVNISSVYGNLKGQEMNLDILAGKKFIFEFTDPNPFKEFHIGHLYSNTVGESLSRLHEALGATVKRADYFGDVGMHVSKSIWGLEKKLQKDGIDIDELAKKPLRERIQYLGQSYAFGATAYKEDESAQEEMKDINYAVFMTGQEYLKEKFNWEPQVDYSKYLYQKERKLNLARIKDLYFKGREWSLAYFEEIYKRAGTKFDFYYPESIVGEYGMQTVLEGLEKGVFEKSDGAIIFDGEKYGLHKRVFVNSLGLPTYEAKELGLAPTKYKDFEYDQSIIITGNEINDYFKVLLKALELLKPEIASKTKHIGHGMVRLPEGKMSSRTGKIVTGESLIDLAKEKAIEIVQAGGKITDEKEIDEIAEVVAIGGIKYAFLKSAIGGDVIFSFNESITFEGNSGPYLQYTYARCKSILSKMGIEQDIDLSNLDSSENELLRILEAYPQALVDSATGLTPHLMCKYLFDVAQAFNSFYQKCKVIGSEYESRRLFLTEKTSQILKAGLNTLGIKTVERM